MSREARVDAGAAEEVEGDERLGEEFVPEGEGEVGVGAAEAGDKVVFEGADGAFGGVVAVDVWRSQLEVDVFRCREVF